MHSAYFGGRRGLARCGVNSAAALLVVYDWGMPEFTVNPTRFDPYKNFKFRVKWDGRYVAGISHVRPPLRRTEGVEHRGGGDPSISRQSPRLTAFAPVTHEQALSHRSA